MAYVHHNSHYIPALLLGVWVTLEPAPMPACLGVPGTTILELEPDDILVAMASSAAFFADLEFLSVGKIQMVRKSALFALPSDFCLDFCSLGEFAIDLPSIAPIIEVLLFDRVENRSELR